MLKPKSPRVLLAAATAALAVGLSSCSTPQTLMPYTPAQGVNVDAPRIGAPADSTEVPLKIRNLLIISTGESTGIVSGALIAPITRADRLTSIEGRPFTAENVPGPPYQPIQANVELPPGQMVVLTDGPDLQITGSAVRPGAVAELKLTFENSQQQLTVVPIVDGSLPEYRQFTTPTPGATPAPGATPSPGTTAAPDAAPPPEAAPTPETAPGPAPDQPAAPAPSPAPPPPGQ